MVQRTRTEGIVLRSIQIDIVSIQRRVGPSQAETLLRVTSGIAAELIKAHNANQTVSLNELRAKMSKKHGFGGVPRLVDIISAIPDDYKKALLPKLRARPIRTASGVCPSEPFRTGMLTETEDRSGRRDVQATSVSAHRHDWEHLRVCQIFVLCRRHR